MEKENYIIKIKIKNMKEIFLMMNFMEKKNIILKIEIIM